MKSVFVTTSSMMFRSVGIALVVLGVLMSPAVSNAIVPTSVAAYTHGLCDDTDPATPSKQCLKKSTGCNGDCDASPVCAILGVGCRPHRTLGCGCII